MKTNNSQYIEEIYRATSGQTVIRVRNGKSGKLTKANIVIAKKRIPERSLDTIPRHESGGRYSGTYYTVALVVGDNWRGAATIHTTII